MKNLFKEAHKMTREIVREYGVDYKTQFALCASYLAKNKGGVEMEILKVYNWETRTGKKVRLIVDFGAEHDQFKVPVKELVINGRLIKENEQVGIAHYGTKGMVVLRVDGKLIEVKGELKAMHEYFKQNPEKKKEDIEATKAVELAKETGEEVVIRKVVTECNDSREECDLDTVHFIATPGGKIRVERYHMH